jgi:DMSO/TMAO reductase YedYZ molybdopterin-dependent catalytic subunit
MSVLKDLRTPVFYAEGVQQIDAAAYRLSVGGLLEKAREFTFDDLKNMKKTVVDSRLTSVSGWSVRADWGGVLFVDFLNELDLKPQADHVIFSSDGDYDTCVSLDDLKQPRVMICYEVGGGPIEAEYGGPVRMFIPHLWGYKSCKGMTSMNFTDRMHGGYWEDRGYPRTAPIEPGTTFDVNTRTRRPISGGEVTEF